MSLSKDEREELINEARAIRKQYQTMQVNNEFTQDIKDYLKKRYDEIDEILRIDAIPIDDDDYRSEGETGHAKPPINSPRPVVSGDTRDTEFGILQDARAGTHGQEAVSTTDEIVRTSSTHSTERSDTKVCPTCAETIKSAAVKCRYCGHMFDRPSSFPIIPTYDSVVRNGNRTVTANARTSRSAAPVAHLW